MGAVKAFLALLFFILMGVFAHGQTSCSDNSIAEFSSRGIKLGATINDIVAKFGTTDEEKRMIRSGFRSLNTDIGYESFGVSPKAPNDLFIGIYNYGFEFLDGRLTGISIGYVKPKWINVGQFRNKLGESIDLPKPENWKTGPANRMNAECGNYLIELWVTPDFIVTYSGLRISDRRVQQILNERRSKIDERQREKDMKVFKP